MAQLSIQELEKIIEPHIHHYRCDGDSWYSCPMAEDGCSNDETEQECKCGRWNKITTIAVEVYNKLVEKNRESDEKNNTLFHLS